MSGIQLFRATLFHTPVNPFRTDGALVAHEDGGLVVRDGRIVDAGDYSAVHARHPHATTTDWRGGYLMPGFVDTHIHFPQARIIGGLGRPLLEWLEQVALPEEARMADDAYAQQVARGFLRQLAAHGTTTAMVFGAHFARAMEIFFAAAAASGLRIASGLVVSDRSLRPELHVTTQQAHQASTALIRRFHRQGRLRYAVMPRFALSTTEPMLEACQSLLSEHPDVGLHTHINENRDEIASVARLFPWAADYLAVYERFGLIGRRSVLAHSVWSSDDELRRIAGTGASVAHCPCSNAALGSGLFPLQRHLNAGVTVSLGTDVGGGTGFSMMKEALQAYTVTRLVSATPVEPSSTHAFTLEPAALLYLSTRAGAEALGLDDEIGDFAPGKAADFVYLRPPSGSALAAVLERSESLTQTLAALFTLAGAESVREVHVAGASVYTPETSMQGRT